jgi:membrane protease YdiL (CAAX protease family)
VTPDSLLRRVLAFPLVRLVVAVGLTVLFSFLSLVALRATGAEGMFSSEAAIAVSTLIALGLTVRLLERRPFFSTLLPRAGAARDLGIGFALGGGLISASVGVLAIAGCYRVEGHGGLGGIAVARSLAFFLTVAVFEEALFRGILYRLLEETFGTWIALGASALVFGFAHLSAPGGTVGAAVAVAVEAGVLLGAIFLLRRTLWMIVGVHWAWNFFEGPVFGAPVSGSHAESILASSVHGPILVTGGAFGPEAGVVCLCLCTAAGVAFLIHAVRRGRPMGPMWRRRPESGI